MDMKFYEVVLGTYYQGLIATHSEEEAMNIALDNVLPGADKRGREYEKDASSVHLIEPAMFKEPTMII